MGERESSRDFQGSAPKGKCRRGFASKRKETSEKHWSTFPLNVSTPPSAQCFTLPLFRSVDLRGTPRSSTLGPPWLANCVLHPWYLDIRPRHSTGPCRNTILPLRSVTSRQHRSKARLLLHLSLSFLLRPVSGVLCEKTALTHFETLYDTNRVVPSSCLLHMLMYVAASLLFLAPIPACSTQ